MFKAILIMLALSPLGTPMELIDDDDAMIKRIHRDIYLQVDKRNICYQIDSSVIATISQSIPQIKSNCELSNLKLPSYKYKKPIPINTKTTKLGYDEIYEIKMTWESFKQSNYTDCTKIATMNELIESINSTISKFKHNEKYSILDITTIESLMTEARHATQDIEPYQSTPFAYDFAFTYNLFNYSKSKYMSDNEFMYFIIEIPIYEKIALFKMSPKPMIIANDLRIFNLSIFYASVHPRPILYTISSKKNNCQWARSLKKELCKQPKVSEQCSQVIMNHLLHGNTSSDQCMRKLAKGNYMTHSLHQVHFTVIEPVSLNISCPNDTKSFLLKKSKTLVDASNCIISKDTLKYGVNNTMDYKLINIPSGSKYNESVIKIINWTFITIIIFATAIIGCEILGNLMTCMKEMPEQEIETTPNEMLNNEANIIKDPIYERLDTAV